MKQISEIIYIHPQRNYAKICELYVDRSNQAQAIFLPNTTHLKRFCDQALLSDIDIHGRVLSYHTIDPESDDFLYRSATRISALLLNLIRRCSHSIAGDAYHLFPQAADRALEVALLDRFVAVTRGLRQFHLQTVRHPHAKVRVVLGPAPSGQHTLRLFLGLLGCPTEFLDGHLHARSRLKVRAPIDAERWTVGTTFSTLVSFEYKQFRLVRSNSVLFVTNVRDKQYRRTIVPIVRKMREDGDRCALLSTYRADEDSALEDLSGIGLPTFFKDANASLASVDAFAPDARRIVRSALRRFEKMLLDDHDDRVRPLTFALLEYARTNLVPLLHHARTLSEALQPIVARARGVVVAPGRYLEAHLSVAMARAASRPTIEIQGGPIAASPRFVAPTAEDVLCIDKASFHIYTDHLKHPSSRTFVVGSPKIDWDIRPYSATRRDEARQHLRSVLGKECQSSIVFLATQPIGVERAVAVVRLALDAIKRTPNYTLLIKQHPGEDSSYAQAYINIAQDLSCDRLVVSSEGHTQACIVAADVVLTYYSTVGLEAFALKRPVVVVNPFEGRPPFDLVSLGIAQEARSAEELAAILRNPGQVTPDPGLFVLQDGQAVERCLAIIRERMPRRTLLDRLRPSLRIPWSGAKRAAAL